MREGQFIKQNLDRWQRYEEPASDPDETAKRFTYLVDDLSYAKTFYPSSNTVRYINSLAANIYLSIYKNKKEKSHRIVTFWTTELPLTVRKHHRTLLFAFLFFATFVLIGIFSQTYEPSFIRSILGDNYVDMTERNIANNDPFGVYKSGNALVMFLSIALNNIRVSFVVFGMGITASVGTLYMMFQNSIMLGAFECMFFQRHLGVQSLLVVFIHGTLEISALVISGASGLVMGNAILFPKTYTRMQSLMRGAKDGLKIIIGLVPIFLTAAFFEGFVTRHTGMPVWMSLMILLCSLAFMLWYFVFYPIRVSKKHHNAPAEE